MQQGDCNSPDTIQKTINNLVRDELGIYVHDIIYDMFIFSKTKKQHVLHVRTVLPMLKDHKFYASSDKSEFLADVLSVLAYITTKEVSPPYLRRLQKSEIGPILKKGSNCVLPENGKLPALVCNKSGNCKLPSTRACWKHCQLGLDTPSQHILSVRQKYRCS